MPLRNWHPPPRILPSLDHKGENERRAIYEAVGMALDEWEQLEVLLAQLFAVLCESTSAAARRAYGTITGPFGKREALEHAALEFFEMRQAKCKGREEAVCQAQKDGVSQIVSGYGRASEYRNNIAHGTTSRFYIKQEHNGDADLGYFLHAPPYATRKLDPKEYWRSSYFYRKTEIEHCATRFKAIAFQADTYVLELNLD